MSGFDWPSLMRAGIKGLGLRPTEFWALSPAELLFLLGRPSHTAPLTRARLAELADLYPDNSGDEQR